MHDAASDFDWDSFLHLIASQTPLTMAHAVAGCVDVTFNQTDDAERAFGVYMELCEGLRELLPARQFSRFEAALERILDLEEPEWIS